MTIIFNLLLSCLLPAFSQAAVTIENNGYRGIEVVVHEDVPENLMLLEKIKEMIKKSSPWLYNTTKQRAYFEDVTIVLPSTWSSKPEYNKVPQDDYYETATLRIGPPHPSYNHTPYTFQPGGCGEFGRFIHMTPDYILNFEDRTAGPLLRNSQDAKTTALAKVFVHEWFHLRYGVFNEFPTKDPRFPAFYKTSNNGIAPNACPATIKGRIKRQSNWAPCIIDRLGNVIGDCTFIPGANQNTNTGASLMFMPQLPQAYGPCEDDQNAEIPHNIHAPNEHNLKCNKRSVRNVMESGEDFRNNRNPPRNLTQIEPKITVVHLQNSTYPGYVLVLDVSSSMAGKPWEELKDATSRAIKYKAKSSCPLGMVSFSNAPTVLAPLTAIDVNSRNQLLTKIPAGVGGYTAIGQGLSAAMQVLGANNKPLAKGKIILITDGEENVPPNIADVTKPIVDANVIVYGIAFGAQASKKVEDLCHLTGGKGWLYNSAQLTQSVDSILDEIFQSCGPVKDRPVINKNGAFKLLVGDNTTGIFLVENGALKTSVSISYDYPDRTTNDGQPPVFTLTSPSGRQYNAQSPEYNGDPNFKTAMYEIGTPEAGSWTYNIKNQESNYMLLNLIITSETGRTKDDPIRVNSWIDAVNLTYPYIPKIYAEVKKLFNPILNANVTANVRKPNGQTIKVPLKDDGKGADATANDGVYSEYYTHYSGDGRYAIDISVENKGKAGITTNPSTNLQGAPDLSHFPPELLTETTSEEAATEFSLSDMEQVDEIFENSAVYDAVQANRESDLTLEKVEEFERFATAGTFILSNWSDKDLIPPGRINDLKVTNYDVRNRTVALEWTSVGDDMFSGQGTTVDLRYHPDLDQLLHSFNTSLNNFTILNGSLQPLESYETQRVQLQLPSDDQLSLDNTSEIIHFAVRTLDEEGNAGDISNIVLVNFQLIQLPLSFPTATKLNVSCDKYIKLFKRQMPKSPKFMMMNVIKNGKGPWVFQNALAKFDFGKPCKNKDEMQLQNIPKHCLSTIKELEKLQLAKTSTTTDVPSEDEGEYGIENENVYVKKIWRMWWKPRRSS